MEPTPEFRTDLYRGTADYYARYRVAYPAALVEDLVARSSLSGSGRLLDLACGPGRATFALAGHFAEVVAIDQEEEAVSHARTLAVGREADHVDWRHGRAEDLDAAGRFEMVTIGDAFHRLDRRRVADRIVEWLQPHGHVALLWTTMPWQGSAPWQLEAMELVVRWMQLTGSIANIPANLAETLVETPNLDVLADAGLTPIGSYRFVTPHVWTLESLAGFAYSTSILSREVLGNQVDAFESDLRDRLLQIQPDGAFEDSVSFSYDLAVKP